MLSKPKIESGVRTGYINMSAVKSCLFIYRAFIYLIWCLIRNDNRLTAIR